MRNFFVGGYPGKPQAPQYSNPCRGRFYIGPVCAAAQGRNFEFSKVRRA